MQKDYAEMRGAILRDLDGLRVDVDTDRRIGWLWLDRPPLNVISYKGGSQRVARIAGLTRAVDMMMLGRRIPAPEAHAWGLLTRVAEDGAALDRMIDEVTKQLTAQSALALKTIKRVLNTTYDTSLAVGM